MQYLVSRAAPISPNIFEAKKASYPYTWMRRHKNFFLPVARTEN